MREIKVSPLQIRELLVKKVGKNLLWGLERIISRFSLVPTTPFLNSKEFDWIPRLEENWETVRGELDQILQYTDDLPRFQDISPDQAGSISKDNLWKTFFLYGYGVKMEQNCQYCPQTTRIIEDIPGLKTAFFSILLPGKHIPEHRGPFKGVLRCHLALKVPQAREQCGIRVDSEVYNWTEGEAVVFDDSYPHEAWNKSDEVRVVLFLDIMRPMMFPASLLNQLLITLIRWSPFIRDAEKNQRQWDRKIAQVFNKN
ncbi:MAG: aspartyl/asparaginyl beta-hydroxylase domain-containing protein [Cyanobacteria bacterium J06621_8]